MLPHLILSDIQCDYLNHVFKGYLMAWEHASYLLSEINDLFINKQINKAADRFFFFFLIIFTSDTLLELKSEA